MSEWRRYDSHLIPAFHERFEERWGKGTAPFLDPEAHEEPLPRAQWINPSTGAALAVVPVWSDGRPPDVPSACSICLPPAISGCSVPATRGTLSRATATPNTWSPSGTTPTGRPWPTPRSSSSAAQ